MVNFFWNIICKSATITVRFAEDGFLVCFPGVVNPEPRLKDSLPALPPAPFPEVYVDTQQDETPGYDNDHGIPDQDTEREPARDRDTETGV
jgi:hypothetical protein